MRRVFLDKCPEAKCREKPWKVRARTNGTQADPADRKILRFINSAKSSTTKQMVHWWISCLSIPIKKTKWDVDNRHSKECRSFAVDLHCNTFKIRFWVVYTQANGDACRRDRTRNTQPPNADTIDFFFFWSEKKGVSSAPSELPLATCLERGKDFPFSTATVSFHGFSVTAVGWRHFSP